MFTYVASYGNSPQWLPPSMAVHHGDWKLISTFHHGEDEAHEYRLSELRESYQAARSTPLLGEQTVDQMDATTRLLPIGAFSPKLKNISN